MATKRRRSSPRRSGGGGGGTINFLKGGLWFIFVGALIVGFFQIPANPTAAGIPEILQSKSNTVSNWAKSCGEAVTSGSFNTCFISPQFPEGGGSGGVFIPTAPGGGGVAPNDPNAPGGGTVGPPESLQQLDALTVAPASNASYNRDEWKHWVSAGSGCWDVRDQVLYQEAEAGSVTLLDKKKKPTTDLASACFIASGVWNDPYSGERLTDPSGIDIDHMIPLNYAAQHGGQAWDSARKQAYANNLDYANHLIAVKAGENRTKSDKGPSEWMPTNTAYHCQYAQDWIAISSTWGLSVDAADKDTLKNALATCG